MTQIYEHYRYVGKVNQPYVNDGNLIPVYFENAVDPEVPQEHGMNVTKGGAAALSLSDNTEFSKLFYLTELAAHASCA